MKVVNPKNLMAFLNEEGLRAKKSFSQNFLVDGNIIRKIIKAASLSANDIVVEIGPGPGALTEGLLESGATVIAIELDRGFSSKLLRLQTEDQRLHIFEADALGLDYNEILSPYLKEGKKAKLVANLPYAITTPILAKILPLRDKFEKATIMIQKEMADRILSITGKDYSSLSVFVKMFANVDYEFTVEPTCFYPKPKVKSSVISLDLKPPLEDLDLEAFLQFMRKAFSQRRKMLTSIFKGLIVKELLQDSLNAIGLTPTARAEEINPDNFVKLFKILVSSPLFSKIKRE